MQKGGAASSHDLRLTCIPPSSMQQHTGLTAHFSQFMMRKWLLSSFTPLQRLCWCFWALWHPVCGTCQSAQVTNPCRGRDDCIPVASQWLHPSSIPVTGSQCLYPSNIPVSVSQQHSSACIPAASQYLHPSSIPASWIRSILSSLLVFKVSTNIQLWYKNIGKIRRGVTGNRNALLCFSTK